MVLMWVRRTSLPHMTESPRLQLSSDAPRIHQYELESVSPRKPVTDCWPEPDPYVTFKCNKTCDFRLPVPRDCADALCKLC